ncbi:MAG: hypothetical protein ACYS8Y_07485 [Planctomycetota bacterium]|jgi:hypothetical protein
MAKSDITEQPERTAGDAVYTLAKAGVAAVAVGAGKELFSSVITPSLEKRRDKWIESVAGGLKKLEEKVEDFKIENLRENESFVSVVMQASKAAIRNHREEKLEALRNVVLNAARPNAIEENLQLVFLNVVDSLTPSHIKVLKLLYYKTPQTELADYESKSTFYGNIKSDLENRGLLLSYKALTLAQICRSSARCLTDLGEQFIKFISSPFGDKNNGGSVGKNNE